METAIDLINILNATDETNKIEAKRGSAIDKSILQSICAFSNEPGLGGGHILLGVVPDKMSLFPQYEAIGISNPDKLQLDLASQCASVFNIPVRPSIEVEVINGKNIVKIYVPELQPSQKPLYFANEGLPKGAYRRIGSSDQHCSEDDLMIFYNHQESFDNTVITDTSLSDIDENALRQYRLLRSKVQQFAEELNYSDEELLISLGCVKKIQSELKLTYAGLIVFGSAMAQRRLLPALRVDYVRVSGNSWISDPENRFTTIDMRGPLILLIQRAYNAIADDLPKGFLLPEGQIQATSIGLPGRVLREALVNSFIHRSYKVNQPIQIIRYSNRIEILNPGFSLKPEDQLGDPGSNQRNPFIAAIFHETNLAETKGSGIRTMRRLMEKAGMVPPTFESNHTDNRFTARLLLHHFLSEEDIKWLDTFTILALNDHQKQALVFVKEVGAIDNATYRQLSGSDILKSSADLRALRDNGLLEAKGKGKNTYYIPGNLMMEYEFKEGVLGASHDLIEPVNDLIEPVNDLIEPVDDLIEPVDDLIEPVDDPIEPDEAEILNTLPLDVQQLVKSIGKRTNDRDDIENVILKICSVRPFSIKELSQLLGRRIKHLNHSYIKPLRIEGKLKYTIPDMPNHPEQAYITAKVN